MASTPPFRANLVEEDSNRQAVSCQDDGDEKKNSQKFLFVGNSFFQWICLCATHVLLRGCLTRLVGTFEATHVA